MNKTTPRINSINMHFLTAATTKPYTDENIDFSRRVFAGLVNLKPGGEDSFYWEIWGEMRRLNWSPEQQRQFYKALAKAAEELTECDGILDDTKLAMKELASMLTRSHGIIHQVTDSCHKQCAEPA